MSDWTPLLEALSEPAAWWSDDAWARNSAWADDPGLPSDPDAMRALVGEGPPSAAVDTPWGRFACAPAGDGLLVRRIAEPPVVRSDVAALYRALFDGVTDGLFLYDDAMRLVDVNEAACRMHGRTRDEMLALDPSEFVAPESLLVFHDFLATLRTQATFEAASRGRRPDGSTFPVAVHGVPLRLHGDPHYLGTVRDLSQVHTLQERLTEAQRLEGLGRMAGGVAHDFNNLLTVLLASVGLASEHLPEDHEVQPDLRTALQAAMRARAITGRLLTFSRQRVLDVRDIDLHTALVELGPILRRLVPPGITWSCDIEPALGRVRMAAGDLDQLLINLVVNATDAMPDGGALALVARRAGDRVVLEVRDTGVGIPEAHRARLFEPFFTTREASGGSGLGLATVHGIVQQVGGTIEVASTVGEGTTFTIALPSARAPSDPATPLPPPAPGARQTVLLAEDDPTIRRLIRVLLEREGIEVHAATGYADAHAWLESHAPPGLLVTDLRLGDGSGIELTAELRARAPQAQVLWVSGHTPEAVERPADIHFLAKPFSRHELLAAVEVALGRRPAPTDAS